MSEAIIEFDDELVIILDSHFTRRLKARSGESFSDLLKRAENAGDEEAVRIITSMISTTLQTKDAAQKR